LRNRNFARLSRWAAAIALALGIASGAIAQETIEQRMDRLEKANADLQRQVSQQQSAPSASPSIGFEANTVAAQGMPAASGPAAASASTPNSGYAEVGSVFNMTVAWKDGLFFSTPNKDFTAHIGGWAQYDNYWFSYGV
jgi:hypothetical protein